MRSFAICQVILLESLPFGLVVTTCRLWLGLFIGTEVTLDRKRIHLFSVLPFLIDYLLLLGMRRLARAKCRRRLWSQTYGLGNDFDVLLTQFSLFYF